MARKSQRRRGSGSARRTYRRISRRVRHRTKAGWVDLGVPVSGQLGQALNDVGGIGGAIADPQEFAAWGIFRTTGVDRNGEFHSYEAGQSLRKAILRSLAWGVGKRIGQHVPGIRDILIEGSRVRFGGRPLWRLKGR